MDLERCKRAHAYHKKGFNCCQSVAAAFSDLTGLSENAICNAAAGFGAGAGTGELCGAVVGAIITLGLLTPVDMEDPVDSKKRTVALGKELQKRFFEKGHALRCQDLLADKTVPGDHAPAAMALGLTGHCDIMIVTAVELVEEILAERG